jgi:MFS family permease
VSGKPGRRTLLLTTSLAAFMTPFISSAISFGVPRIGASLHLDFYEAALLPITILIPLASFMLLFGKLSDEFGRVRFFRIGLVIFSVAALAVPFTGNFYVLEPVLFILGTGSAILSTNSTAIVSYAYSGGGRGFALGINAMSVYLGLTLAPLLGGFLIEFFGWRSIFYLVVPVALISLSISFFSLKGLEIRKPGPNVNVAGSALFAVAILSIAFFLSLGYIVGFLKILFLLLIFAVSLLLFLRDEIRSKNPVIPVDLLKGNRTFIASNFTAFLNYVSTFSIVFVFSIYLQIVMHISPFLSGILLLPEPLLMVVFSPVAGKLSDTFGSRSIASAGMIMIGLSFLLFSYFPRLDKIEIILLLAVLGTGFGLFSAPNTNSVMGSVKMENSGIASGFLGTMRFMGQMGSIILATIVLSSYMPKTLIIGMFSGIYEEITPQYFHGYLSGFRIVMLISAILSFCGAFTSLLRNKGVVTTPARPI